MEHAVLKMKPSPWRWAPAIRKTYRPPIDRLLGTPTWFLYTNSYITFNLSLANRWLAKYN